VGEKRTKPGATVARRGGQKTVKVKDKFLCQLFRKLSCKEKDIGWGRAGKKIGSRRRWRLVGCVSLRSMEKIPKPTGKGTTKG